LGRLNSVVLHHIDLAVAKKHARNRSEVRKKHYTCLPARIQGFSDSRVLVIDDVRNSEDLSVGG